MSTHIKIEPMDEAYNLLQNGILVETNKGLVCMSLNDALASDLNLSVEDLKNVASELISQQNHVPKPKERIYLKSSNLNFDSDGFSSECSDVSFTSVSSFQSGLIAFTPVPSVKVIAPKEVPTQSQEESVVLEPPTVAGVSIKVEPLSDEVVHKPPKRRGGWPKGRKRKPELLNLPPKAPATGYNLYLNETRKLFKDSDMVFHEITKIIGNRWSNLSLEEKSPYLARAEEDKRRYREELKQYRQSDAYRAYLAKKRQKMQNSAFSESDMDATDEIDDEDNEELYCRTCDQWFHSLHNKREHLQGRQHTQSVAGDIKQELDAPQGAPTSLRSLFSTSFDESSLDACPVVAKISRKAAGAATSVSDCISNLVLTVSRREKEITLLKRRLDETTTINNDLCKKLNEMRQIHNKLKTDMCNLKKCESDMDTKVAQLWQVPSWFIVADVKTGN